MGGGFLLAAGRELQLVAPSGEIVARWTVIDDRVASRLNDGGCDPAGRFLVGSLPLDGRRGQERLWRLDRQEP